MELTTFLIDNLTKESSITDYPQRLDFPSNSRGGFLGFGSKNIFWEEMSKLRRFTDSSSDRLKQHPGYSGSTGWEYGIGIFLFGQGLYYSDIFTSRDYTSVQTQLSAKIEVSKKDGSSIDSLIVNDKVLADRYFYTNDEIKERNDLISANSYPFKLAGVAHTHPIVTSPFLKKDYYSFFSNTDIYSFISTKTPFTFLLTDRLWVLGMTAEFKNHHNQNLSELSNDLAEVSRAELKGVDDLYSAASSFARRYELALYVAEMGGSLYRI